MRINYKIDWQALGGMQGSKSLGAKKYLILEAALKIMATKGLHNLSVTEVAKASDLSKPLVLYHYSTKEQILEDLCFYLLKMGEYFQSSAIDEDHSFEEKIRETIRATFKWYHFNKEVCDFLYTLPHLREKGSNLKQIIDQAQYNETRHWERIFLESLRYRSMEELKIAVFGVRTLLRGTLYTMNGITDQELYTENILRLKFNLETLLKVELPSFDFD